MQAAYLEWFTKLPQVLQCMCTHMLHEWLILEGMVGRVK